MVRINLLPREIVEKRKWERYYPIVFTVAGIGLAVVLVAAVGLFLWVQNQRQLLQDTQQQAQKLAAQAQQFAIFEQKEQVLTQRSSIAQSALDGRVNWARVANEVSLILPDEVWVTSIKGNQTSDFGLQLTCITPYFDPSAADEGYKSAAKCIARLNSLPDVYSTWLNNATAGTVGLGQNTDADTVSFSLSAKVLKPVGAPVAVAVPAPPSTPGQ
jgi:Tfp pilus assembly protein PilN